ncbi:MAG: hypothetical protein ABI688_04385 [Bacteroidota bacterium]
MPDNPRMPGHPSDIPSSRSSEGSTGSAGSGHPGNPPYNHPPATSPGSSGNNQTRTIIIGAIATIIASTSVYYLTQYINNKKSDSTPSQLVMKEATTNAWKRYVTMENIYYKAAIGITRGKTMAIPDEDEGTFALVDKFVNDLAKEAAIFKKDAAKIAEEENVDPALKSMLARRIERQTEFNDMITVFVQKAKTIYSTTKNPALRDKKINTATQVMTAGIKLVYEKAATEVEELSKTLTATYAVTFDPNEVQIYADYKKSISNRNALSKAALDTADYTRNIPPKSLVGSWDSHGDKINLLKDNGFDYSLRTGEKMTGTWKIENGKLRMDGVDPATKQKLQWLFLVKDIAADSFTMTLSISPFTSYDFTRVKAK